MSSLYCRKVYREKLKEKGTKLMYLIGYVLLMLVILFFCIKGIFREMSECQIPLTKYKNLIVVFFFFFFLIAGCSIIVKRISVLKIFYIITVIPLLSIQMITDINEGELLDSATLYLFIINVVTVIYLNFDIIEMNIMLQSVMTHLGTSAIVFGIFYAIYFFLDGIGGGDVKLFTALSFYFTLSNVITFVVWSLFVGICYWTFKAIIYRFRLNKVIDLNFEFAPSIIISYLMLICKY